MGERRPEASGNWILDRLIEPEAQPSWSERARRTRHALGEELYREEGPLRNAYFPITAVFSTIVGAGGGTSAEVSTIGNEGLAGLSLFFGLERSPYRVIVQVAGDSVQVPAAVFRRASREQRSLDAALRCYAAYALRSAQQAVACNALHSAEERAARWLLTTRDRARSDDFVLSHEFLAEMLGVRRQTVSLVAASLQRAGLVRYRRAQVQLLDAAGLEAVACECYGILRRFQERLLGDTAP